MTQFRLRNSPQSFIHDSPQSFLHGTVELQPCYLFPVSADDYLAWLRFTVDVSFSPTGCVPSPDPNIPAEIRGANAQQVTGFTGDETFRAYVTLQWVREFDAGTQLITDFRTQGTVIGSQSGTMRPFGDMPLNYETGNNACGWWDGIGFSVQTELGQSVICKRLQFANATSWDATYLRTVIYSERIFAEDAVAFGDRLDLIASSYFNSLEDCYFEGCPPPP